ncbi:endoribonuclease Dicer [Diorhabda carinulata]|uniref:endoribonuclease Dicer n=1 Tax=Diorhabda carinulata TaxID=1163345 RepID=UPI0025A26B18|nr:endoribonuclease Dicer [Diorhabda carinulata]
MSDQEEFIPRNYQEELMKICLEQNTIIFLPTGSGKTFIALLVLKQMGADLLKSYSQGGKITIILVNTIALVDQHADNIIKHTGFNVGRYTGEMNLDFWPKTKWYEIYDKHQVIIMTSQILVNLVHNSYIDLNRVNLLIFDECHRGVNDHSMRQLMKQFHSLHQPPRVLGLTATLLNGNCKPGRVIEEVKSLETTYQSKVATVEELKSVVGYSTNPMEKLKIYGKHLGSFTEKIIIEELSKLIDTISYIKSEPIPISLCLKGLKPLKLEEGEKKLRNLIQDLIFHVETMGPYGGLKACLSHIIQIERIKKHCDDLQLMTILTCVQTTFMYVLEQFKKHMTGMDEKDKMLNFCSHKLISLFEILDEYKKVSKEELCCIIFTKRRFTAKVIFHVLKDLSEYHPDYAHIKTNFMVGYNNNPYNDTRESLYISKQNKQVLDGFRNKEINVLVASNVLEEGVDIPKCTLVIKYDHPEDYRSYVQSKGRARHMKSLYYMMVCEEDRGKFIQRYNEFRQVEEILNDYLIGTNSEREDPSVKDIVAMYNEDIIPPYYVNGPTSAQVNMTSAISLLCQYCMSLPSDIYTVRAPDWFFRMVDQKISVVILLPVVCPILDEIVGPPMVSKKLAKRAAAMVACIKLHKAGELDDHLVPKKNIVKEEDVDFLFSHYPKEKDPTAGNLKTKRLHKKLFPAVLNKPILPNTTLLVHTVKLNPLFTKKTEDVNFSTMFDMYTSPLCYGLVTNSPLPTICDFPIYVTSGTITVSLEVNKTTITVTDKNLEDIVTFHYRVFEDVIQVLQRFLIFDRGDNPEMMLLVPFDRTKGSVDWDLLRRRTPVNSVEEMSVEEKMKLEVNLESHLRKIVSPWYRRDPAVYIVTEVCFNRNAFTEFPNDEYANFGEYFRLRHNLEIRNPELPLLLVKRLTKSLNFIKPKSRISIKRKHEQTYEEMVEYLPAELVVKQDFPASLWIQANLLPTILTRISFFLQLEELRQRIATEAGLGRRTVIQRMPLQLDEYLLSYVPHVECDNHHADDLPTVDMNVSAVPVPQTTLQINKDFSEKLLESQYPWKNIDEPIDIERDLKVSIMDIEHYEAFIGQPVNVSREYKNNNSPSKEKQLALTYHKNFLPADIKILDADPNDKGPELCEMFRALTTAKANEIVNLERSETLGDSYLKMIVSVYVYLRFPHYDEGRATQLKGKLVSNRNLFYLALEKNLNGVMKYNELSSESEWMPPGFDIPREMSRRIENGELSVSALFGLRVPEAEQISGRLSKDTVAEILGDECPVNENEECNYRTMAQFLKSQFIADKFVSDTVESLLGVYLQTGGLKGATRLLEWFGVIPKSEKLEKLLEKPPPTPLLNDVDDIESKLLIHLPTHKQIEKIIGYEFKNKSYLLQAFTHSSYTPNRTTLSYERLEFVGDAVLDFLITCFVYESCGNLDPGKLTDLRSSLVNNNTFASLIVRMGLHKYILMINSKLQKFIDDFVLFMEQKNYVIDDEIMILLQEDEYQFAESVDVPKILGDIFEAIAGAIYLDSNKDLKTVWRVFYKIMWKEIDLFSQNIPKNVVRRLFEWNGAHPKFGQVIPTTNRKCMVPLRFMLDGVPTFVHGFGTNKTMAKKAAAKIALKLLYQKDK